MIVCAYPMFGLSFPTFVLAVTVVGLSMTVGCVVGVLLQVRK